jgi:hypothetical protein
MRGWVDSMHVRVRSIVSLALLAFSVGGCTQSEDGAVEVSWKLFDERGQSVSCDDKVGITPFNIERMALYWAVTSTSADGSTSTTQRATFFTCNDLHGVTGFDIPPGTVSLWLEPDCALDASVCSFIAPPPIVRTITAGDVVTLDAQVIQVKVSKACICQ